MARQLNPALLHMPRQGGLRLRMAWEGKLEEWRTDTQIAHARAITKAVFHVGGDLLDDLRDDMRSARRLGGLANSWRAQAYPKQGGGRSSALRNPTKFSHRPAAFVYSTAEEIVRAFDEGEIIRPRDATMLAVPIKGSPAEHLEPLPRVVDRGAPFTPGAADRGGGGSFRSISQNRREIMAGRGSLGGRGYFRAGLETGRVLERGGRVAAAEKKWGPLFVIPKKGSRPAMLAAEMVGFSKSGRLSRRKRTKTGKLRKGTLRSLPLFYLFDMVRVRKRLHASEIIAEYRAAAPGLVVRIYARRLPEELAAMEAKRDAKPRVARRIT